MDQGVIRCLKAHYRRRLVRLMILRLDQGRDFPKITILSALQLLVTAWNNVKEATIANCFRKANTSEENKKDAGDDTDDPLKALPNWDTKIQPYVWEEIRAVDIVNTDASVITTDAPWTDEEIFAEYFEENNIDDADDTEEEVVTKPTASEVGSALETRLVLWKYCRIYAFLAQKQEQKCKVFFIDLNHYIGVIKLQQRNNLVFRITLRENKLSIIHKVIVVFLLSSI